ncbi:MAG: DUF4256 domain-containing protein [Candidatus Peregrinibacteria bacterium]|nr:DUF4256 domain-containing protein [Candidatus Peregrinibacteria bacterium]
MQDRRQNEQLSTPEGIAEARLATLRFREGDDERAILLAMAGKINAKYGVVLKDAVSTDTTAEGQASEQIGSTTIPAVARKPELTPEQQWFGEFKARFDALPQLHKGVQWADVEKSLKADPEQLRKLQTLDEKGHDMNVFGEENGEFVFASGWSDYNKVSSDHRNIAYDLEGQKLAESQGYKPTGNAVDIAVSMGADVADPKFHEQLRREVAVNGWAWLKTDATTRKAGLAFHGYAYGFHRFSANRHSDNGSFRAALRVKKA